MNHDIFISYSSKQKGIADGVCHYLEENGFKCWMAPRDIPVGSEYGDLIEEAIKKCKAVVLVFSEAASISKWVKGEINVAFTENKTIFPFRVDSTPAEGGFRLMLNQMHWIDAFPQYVDHLPDLLNSVCRFLGGQPKNVSDANKHLEVGRKAEQEKNYLNSPQPTSKKVIWIGLGVLVVILLVLLLVLPKGHDSNQTTKHKEYAEFSDKEPDYPSQSEEYEWKKAQEEKVEEDAYSRCVTIADCDDYLQNYPYGRFVKEVLAMRTELERDQEALNDSDEIVSNLGSQEGEVFNLNERINTIANSNSVIIVNNSNTTINSNNGVNCSINSSSSQISITLNGVSFVLKRVEGGSFQMGSNDSEADADERPVHSVTVSTFYMGETEVTQALWNTVMGNNPSDWKGDNLPVENVSWIDCQGFINRLNSMTKKEFRLPTEAEWEFAARGGNQSNGYKYAGSNSVDDVAWSMENSGNKTHMVKGRSPNELGIYDMSGNVWEWCSDWLGDYSGSLQTNPTGPSNGSIHVSRGGSWINPAGGCRVSVRAGDDSESKGNWQGFRIVLSI